MSSDLEGVTLEFYIYPPKFTEEALKSIDTLEEVIKKLVVPYKLVSEKYGVYLKNKILWGSTSTPVGTNTTFILNIRGPPDDLGGACEFLFKTYGFPYLIYKPNHFFKEGDTDKGTEIAKEIIIKMGGKVKKRIFPYFGCFDAKYFVTS